jgi:hypothetical protein
MSGMPRHSLGVQEHPRSRAEAKEGVSAMPAIRITRDHPNLMITVGCEPCPEPPEASFYDEETNSWQEPNPGFAADIYKQLEASVDHWPWCDITVTAHLGQLYGSAHMGAATYESEADFKSDPTYQDLVREAIKELQKQIDLTYPLICGE